MYLIWGHMIAIAFSSPLHTEKIKLKKNQEISSLLVKSFLYTHRRELIKCSDVLFQFHFFAVYCGCVLHMGIFHFVASCAERKLVMASLSNLMRATQMLASVQGHIWCSWQRAKEITHMVEEGRSTSEGWLLRHHSTIKRVVLEVSCVVTVINNNNNNKLWLDLYCQKLVRLEESDQLNFSF